MSGIGAALAVAVVAGILEWDIYGWGQTAISRPVIAGTIMGAVLGNIEAGMLVGATVELIYLGSIPVGAAIPPDATSATTIATALTILSGIDPHAAPALAIPVAAAAQALQMLIWTVNVPLMHRADQLAADGNLGGLQRLHLVGAALFFLQGFVPALAATTVGVEAVKAAVQHVPSWVMHGLTVAGGALPALGFAMLFVMMSSRRLLPYFIVGFALAAYFKSSILAAAVLGVAAMMLHLRAFEATGTGAGGAD